jgi:hypothetical protein
VQKSVASPQKSGAHSIFTTFPPCAFTSREVCQNVALFSDFPKIYVLSRSDKYSLRGISTYLPVRSIKSLEGLHYNNLAMQIVQKDTSSIIKSLSCKKYWYRNSNSKVGAVEVLFKFWKSVFCTPRYLRNGHVLLVCKKVVRPPTQAGRKTIFSSPNRHPLNLQFDQHPTHSRPNKLHLKADLV